jgi:hypothetical protein
MTITDPDYKVAILVIGSIEIIAVALSILLFLGLLIKVCVNKHCFQFVLSIIYQELIGLSFFLVGVILMLSYDYDPEH